MSGSEDAAGLFRIERGRASAEELAAVAVTLVALAAGRGGERPPDGKQHRAAHWDRNRSYRSPRSWR
ncbi:acyl-CoA carboxylase subunit epsilon [Streptomyces sp. NBC_00015]|uniref:acyl-CoA carboxylase subunit epsilon n=1 Tax=unclassified Streptomyces TaxID=2593676 RepID=UPI00224D62A5|nr:acyl-CoA carboxylase subunit epsilon [Streptomyces sp. NBC_00103]MCX5372757.1 acyl-CoA carboxylase subunit epsilon [Streptomyces sp. NBC_00103]